MNFNNIFRVNGNPPAGQNLPEPVDRQPPAPPPSPPPPHPAAVLERTAEEHARLAAAILAAPEETFLYRDAPVRMRVIDPESIDGVWLDSRDVTGPLGYARNDSALRLVPAREKITSRNPWSNPREGIPHQLTYITLAGLNHLVMRSNAPEARAVQEWVCREVLPSIQQRRAYRIDERPPEDRRTAYGDHLRDQAPPPASPAIADLAAMVATMAATVNTALSANTELLRRLDADRAAGTELMRRMDADRAVREAREIELAARFDRSLERIGGALAESNASIARERARSDAEEAAKLEAHQHITRVRSALHRVPTPAEVNARDPEQVVDALHELVAGYGAVARPNDGSYRERIWRRIHCLGTSRLRWVNPRG